MSELAGSWSESPATADDVDDLAALLARHEEAARGWASTAPDAVATEVVGAGAATRRHLVVRDRDGGVRAWGTVHDRAAGRVIVSAVVDPGLDADDATALAQRLFDWAESEAVAVARERGLSVTQLDSGCFADDPRQQEWLRASGFTQVRSWWQMTRPVDPAEGSEGAFAPPAPGVVIRRVRGAEAADDAMPDADDLRTVHDVLEASFTDHFNSHEERFEEFVARLRADPGHRWDHWWIAELTPGDGAGVGPGVDTAEPVGALVSSVLGAGSSGHEGSYVEYLGVLAAARGRGVASSLLHTVVADAARRGRDRVGLEVDADNPTGAARLYLAAGFVTRYVTQSWHRDVPVGPSLQTAPTVSP
ncbi:MAG: GNAT family N-acetyltransferase [Angustibacter sp.]